MVQVKWQCCDRVKVVQICVKTPEGEKLFQVCKTHRKLSYFQKYLLGEEIILEDL